MKSNKKNTVLVMQTNRLHQKNLDLPHKLSSIFIGLYFPPKAQNLTVLTVLSFYCVL